MTDVLIFLVGIVVLAFFTLMFLSFAIIFSKSDKRTAEIHKQNDERANDFVGDEPIGGIDKRV